MKPIKVAIFSSGNGSNAEALILHARNYTSLQVEFVLCDQNHAGVLERAKRLDVTTYLVAWSYTRENHEKEIFSYLEKHQVDWIFLAGYMRILSKSFLAKFKSLHHGFDQVVNIHPSLLPAFPGKHAIQRAYSQNVKFGGVTLHLVDAGIDTGPILMQQEVPLGEDESLEQFTQKIHQCEHRLYTNFLTDLALGLRGTQSYLEVLC